MKNNNWIIICSVAILAALGGCNEDKPLQIEPMYAVTDAWVSDTGWVYTDKPVKRKLTGCYYLNHFHDNKEDLKKILQFVNDSSYIVDYSGSEPKYITNPNYGGSFYLENDAYYDDGALFFNGEMFTISVAVVDNTKAFYMFDTPSKYILYPNELYYLPSREYYDYDLEFSEDGELAIVTLDYDKFNIDALQQFLNVVNYWMEEATISEGNRIISIKLDHNPTEFIMKNKRTNKQEAIVKNLDNFYFTLKVI